MIILKQKEYSDEDSYKNIMNIIYSILPKGWNKVILYVQITNESYDIEIYSKVNNKYISNFDLEKMGINKNDIRNIKKELYNLLLPNWKKNKWVSMTYISDKSGKVKIEYDYDGYLDFVESSFDYKRDWKNKYLK